MNTLLLSIIIPMYNVAPYLERCLDSLANQNISYEKYEIICIDDGSPDNCSDIVRNFQKRIPNIILLEQENQGVSMARNNGIAIATGKYMMPIDPDDYVAPNCFKHILNQAETHNLDVLYAAFEIFDIQDKSTWRTNYKNLETTISNGVDGYFAVRGAKVVDPDRSVAILYRMALLKTHKISYPKDVPYLEDGLFLGKVFSIAEKVGYSNRDFYQRTTRPGSATNSNLFHTEKAIDGFLNAALDAKEFASKSSLSPVQQGLINHLVAKFVILSISPSVSKSNVQNYLNVLKKIKDVNIGKLNTFGLRMNFKKIVPIFNFSPIFFFAYFRIYSKINFILNSSKTVN